jgi:hypothetical protein
MKNRKKAAVQKLTLSKETLLGLGRDKLKDANGLTGAYSCPQSCVQECQLSIDTDPCTCGFCQ